MFGDLDPRAEPSSAFIRLKMSDGHRRDGLSEMRVEVTQEPLGNMRLLCLQNKLNPRSEEGNPLQESLHVGIWTDPIPQLKSPRDAGVFLGEAGPHTPQKG